MTIVLFSKMVAVIVVDENEACSFRIRILTWVSLLVVMKVVIVKGPTLWGDETNKLGLWLV